MLLKYLLAVLFSTLCISSVYANEVKPEPYPACPDTPVPVGKEDYQPSNLSLQGLTGLYINLDDVINSATPKNVKLQADLKDAVVKRLEKAGMHLLSKEALEKTPGQPEMSMFPSYPKHLEPFKPGEPRIEYNAQCCTASIWTSFTQGGSTLRHPLLNHKLATWGEGHNTTDCSDTGKWLSEVVLRTVDNFIAAKQKADKDYQVWQKKQGETPAKPKADTPPDSTDKSQKDTPPVSDKPATDTQPVASTDKPVELRETTDAEALACDTAILLYAEIFPTAAASISDTKGGILEKIADKMKACPQYRYRIETHADQRSSHEYNDVLSARRAVAIRNYLVDNGVDEEQFDLRFYGKRKPLVEGDNETAWAANRRIMITPIKPK